MKINKSTLTKMKYVLLTIVFLAVLLGLRFLWHTAQASPEQPYAIQGVLDMRGWDFESSRSITLDGEWEFFPGQYRSEGSAPHTSPDSHQFLQVPGSWSGSLQPGSSTSYGYGTYRLRILVDQPLDQPYGFWFQKIQAANKIIINGKKSGEFGVLAEQPDHYKPKSVSFTASYSAENETEIELLVQAANFDHPVSGGITRSIKFGSQAAIDTERWYSIGFQLFTFVIMLLHALYAIILYCFNPRQKEMIIFALLLFAAGMSIVSDHDSLLLIWLPINYAWDIKIRLLAYVLLSFFILLLTRCYSESDKDRWAFRVYAAALSLYSMFLLLSPVQQIYEYYRIFSFLYLLPVAWAMGIIIRMVVQNYSNAIFLLLAAISVASSVTWGALQHNGIVNGIYYPVDIIAAIVCFSSHWFKRYFRNAKENVLLNEQLKQSDKLKDVFLANTSHELRTPLHGIINIAQTVRANERHTMNEKSLKDLELLVTVSRRMSHLLNDLLDVTRLKDKRIGLQQEQLNVQSAISGVVDMLEYMAKNKPIQLRIEIEESFPLVYADEKRLVQILFNLIHNAIKFTDTGTITLTAGARNDMAFIHVTDTGIGMDAETQARVLLPYEQGTQEVGGNGGIGLGLSICKQLVELHGGELTLESKPGIGSVFTFTLPLYEASHSAFDRAAAATAQDHSRQLDERMLPINIAASATFPALQHSQMEEKTSSAALNILAVDDDPVNLTVLASILSEAQYHIVPVTSGKEALKLLGTKQWDLVITDVMMPHMSGYELTQIIRERFSLSELPILLLTARSQPEDLYTGFGAGANDYVTKPVDALELKYRVWSLTKLKQSVNESLRMEGAYLQAQIQPHFLFNTMNSIMALSETDLDKMRELADVFLSYLRISFDFLNSERLCSLAHELELVQAYLYIEKVRFEERVSVIWEVESNIDLFIPPLTLQPLVENAVKHGLLSRASGGTLHIRIARISGGTLFEVKDDGKGMNADKVSQLLDSSQRGNAGIGLLNTDRRLKQMFGKGLSIHSELGVGTSVSFVIPD